MEQSRVHKAFVELLALVDFAKHELAAESVIFAEGFEELFLVEWFEKLWEVWVDTPVLRQTIKQSLCHMLEVATYVKIVESDAVFTLKIEVIKYEVLWLQLQLNPLKTIV